MSWLYYLLEANLYLLLFFAVYHLLLRRETYYQLNRAYLLVSSAVAFVLPLLQLGILKSPPEVPDVVTQINPVAAIPMLQQMQIHTPQPEQVHINYYLLAYGIVAGLLFFNLFFKLFKLYQLARAGQRVAGSPFRMISIDEEVPAFSFFSYLFINKELTGSDTIIKHELVHIRQRHSWDIIYLEIIKIINWFNPVVYLVQNSLKELHEYIADAQINYSQEDINHYTDFLLSNAYGTYHTSLTNNFFHKNLLKKRIIMLHQKPSGYLARLKYLAFIPAIGGMLCASTLAFSKSYGTVDLLPAKSADGKKDFAQLANYIKENARYTREGVSPQTRHDAHIGTLSAWVTLNDEGKLQNIDVFQGVNAPLMNELADVIKSFNEPINHKAGKYLIDVDFVTPNETADGSSYVRFVGVSDSPNKPDELYLFDGTTPITTGEPTKQQRLKLKKLPAYPPPSVYKAPYAALAYPHIKYPEAAYKAHKEGAVLLSFNLQNNKITDIKVEQGLGYGMDEAAVKVLADNKEPIIDKPGKRKFGIVFHLLASKTLADLPMSIKNDPEFAGQVAITDIDQYVDDQSGAVSNSQQKHMPPPPPPPSPVAVVTKSPYYGLIDYMARNFKLPKGVNPAKLNNSAAMEFHLDSKGAIYDIKVAQSAPGGLDEEVIRLMKNYKTAILDKPGQHIIGVNFFTTGNGKPVTVKYDIKSRADFSGEFFMPFDAKSNKLKSTPPPPPPAPPVEKQPKVSKVEPISIDSSNYHGFGSFYKYVGKYVRYPAKERANTIGGKVFVAFAVDENKHLTGIKTLRAPSQTMSEEVVRVIKNCTDFSNFKPGQTYTLPVDFSLQQADGKWADTHMDNTTDTKEYAGFGTVDTHQKLLSLNEVVVVGYLN